MRDRAEHITEHFTWGEAACKCGCEMPASVEAEVIKSAQMAEKVRAALGNVPMKVNSWYRCPEYNKRIGGKPNSYHTRGQAIDFVVKTMVPAAVQSTCRRLQKDGTVGGLGSYPGFTHIDTGPRRNWED